MGAQTSYQPRVWGAPAAESLPLQLPAIGTHPSIKHFPLPDAIALLKPASCQPSSNIKCSWAILESRIGILRVLSRVHAPFLTSFANLPDVASRKASSDMRKDIRISSTWGLSECTVTGLRNIQRCRVDRCQPLCDRYNHCDIDNLH